VTVSKVQRLKYVSFILKASVNTASVHIFECTEYLVDFVIILLKTADII
jgi:hypothetical protein